MAEQVKLKVPEETTSVSWAGEEIKAIKGFVRVPVESVEHFLAHGLTVAANKLEAAAKNLDGGTGNDGQTDGGAGAESQTNQGGNQ